MQAFIVDLANRPGTLADVCEALGAGGINITGTAGSTAASSGSLAFSAEDHAAARAILNAGGWTYHEVEVVVAAVEHRPGTLGAAARRIADAGVNVDTMFVTGMDGGKVLIAFGVNNAGAAREALGDAAAD